jgi:hypothetical protein
VILHPGCTYREIAKALGLTLEQVHGCSLSQDKMFVRSSTPRAHWWAVEGPEKPGQACQP